MPAPLAKGILISLSLLAALGVAIYENPQIKEWIDEQRRKIAEALRSIGNDLDPASRRQAEAFAYEGRLPTPQEREAAANAVAVATGTESEADAATRRMTMRSNTNPIDAAERRRLGREYLAKKNQDMLERQKQVKKENPVDSETEPLLQQELQHENEVMPTLLEKRSSSGSFDDMVNSDGTLKHEISEEKEPVLDLPSVPTTEPTNAGRFVAEMVGLASAAASSFAGSGPQGLQAGSRYANPFSDEFEYNGSSLLDRSVTPKPPVPPKVALESEAGPLTGDVPGAYPEQPSPAQMDETHEDLSFDEQLARALSLSLAESEEKSRAVALQAQEEHDSDLAAAIALSLREPPQANAQRRPSVPRYSWESAQNQAHVLRDLANPPQTLVDFTPDDNHSAQTPRPSEQLHRELSGVSVGYTPPALSPYSTGDELYTVSPQATGRCTMPGLGHPLGDNQPRYDPVREAAAASPRSFSSDSVSASMANYDDLSPHQKLSVLQLRQAREAGKGRPYESIEPTMAFLDAACKDPEWPQLLQSAIARIAARGEDKPASENDQTVWEAAQYALDYELRTGPLTAQERTAYRDNYVRSLRTHGRNDSASRDYQVRLMLEEYRNKQRLLMAQTAMAQMAAETQTTAPLIDVEESGPIQSAPRTPATLSSGEEGDAESYGFTTDSEHDEFASFTDDNSRTASMARSEASMGDSLVEVEDVDMDSVDSDDDDGIRTPSSWTDVGSDVGESERSESEAGDAIRV